MKYLTEHLQQHKMNSVSIYQGLVFQYSTSVQLSIQKMYIINKNYISNYTRRL